jgi:hypothetical protein
MKTERIEIDGIETGARLRQLNPARVDALVSSISEIGLRTPITVMTKRVDGETGFVLVAGNHRLEALRRLGHEFVDCIVMSEDEIDAQIWEIDENLVRASLTPVEEAEHLSKRKELWEAKQAEIQVEQVVPPEFGYKKPPRQTEGFAANTAEKTGDTKQSINRKISRAKGVIDEVKDLIRGSVLDTGTYLDKLKSLSPNDQMHAAKRDLARARQTETQTGNIARRFKPANEPLSDQEAEERQYAALVSAWNRAGEEARQRFRDLIDEPVFDRKAGAA